MISIEKKKVARTGVASLGWHLGHGYVQGEVTVKTERWCVLEDGKILAECRGKMAAERIAEAFAWEGHGT